jgi:DNA-binding transcriptional regulator YdaS (Cro superfamily)
MGTRDTYHATLVRACIAAGDETQLAKRLNVPLPVLVDWLLGDKPVPAEIFLRSVDIVISANREQVQAVRDFLEHVKRRHRR